MGAIDKKRDDAFAKGNNKELRNQAQQVVKERSQKDQKDKNATQVAAANLDPRKIWQEKLAALGRQLDLEDELEEYWEEHERLSPLQRWLGARGVRRDKISGVHG